MTTTPSSQSPDRSGEALLDEWFKDADLQGLTDGTLQTYRWNLRNAFELIDSDPRRIDRHDLRQILHHLKNEREGQDGTSGVSQSTIENWFSALSSFFRFLKYERYIQDNPVPEFRERYIDFKSDGSSSERQLIGIEEMATLIHGTLNVRDKAINLTFAKTGVRRNELIQIDLSHIDWEEQSIRLRPTPKRSNKLVFSTVNAIVYSSEG